ncbi:MAG: helix-turn-helix transcriptional regulator [Candidatus Omnitrophica bacterium]|nr:helix-turn-helix transcriptional regulator [Candidatus Omnitrophota bacterium]
MVVAIKGQQIKKILAKKNMSQNCFAMRLGVSSGYMSQLMTGIRNPSPGLRVKILSELKIDEGRFDEIFELKG